jgi:hypothetical protein
MVTSTGLILLSFDMDITRLSTPLGAPYCLLRYRFMAANSS